MMDVHKTKSKISQSMSEWTLPFTFLKLLLIKLVKNGAQCLAAIQGTTS